MQTDRQRTMRPRKSRLTVDELKLVTRCGKCGQKGHWHKECPNPEKPRDNGKSSVGFVFTGNPGGDDLPGVAQTFKAFVFCGDQLGGLVVR